VHSQVDAVGLQLGQGGHPMPIPCVHALDRCRRAEPTPLPSKNLETPRDKVSGLSTHLACLRARRWGALWWRLARTVRRVSGASVSEPTKLQKTNPSMGW
jgi:hypothetical protein